MGWKRGCNPRDTAKSTVFCDHRAILVAPAWMASSSMSCPSAFLGLSQPSDIGMEGIINRAAAIRLPISAGEGVETPDMGVPLRGVSTTITSDAG